MRLFLLIKVVLAVDEISSAKTFVSELGLAIVAL